MSYGIRIEDLSVIDPRSGRPIIEDVDLTIGRGSLVGLIGQSGAGKSTLLKALGVRLPNRRNGDRGEIYLEHEGGLSRITPENHGCHLHVISFVPQADLFLDELTAGEVLRHACVFAGFEKAGIRERCRGLMGAVGLAEEIWDRRVNHLSGGQRRRLSIARALASGPEILLLDEPTSGLDLPVAHEVMRLLKDLCEGQELTVVCTSHLPSTLRICDRVLVITPGKGGSGGRVTADYDAESYGAALGAGDEGVVLYGANLPNEQVGGERVRREDLVPPPQPPDLERWNPEHFRAALGRTRSALVRDRGALLVFIAQPIALGFVVVVTQALHGGEAAGFVDFFLTVSAMWIGMSLCVREFVSERERFALDELSGLSKNSYFGSKIAFACAGGAVGVIILWSVATVAVVFLPGLSETLVAQFGVPHIIPRLAVLTIAAISGGMIGLFISAVAPSERSAISLMPLALLPQVVFSRFACGYGANLPGDTGYPYQALQAIVGDRGGAFEFGSGLEWANFLAGLPMTTRHANWCLESTDILRGWVAGQFFWLDFVVLVLLSLAQAVGVYIAFKLCSRRWLSLIR